MKLRVACAQLAPHKADLAENIRRICDSISQASEEGAEIVAFSETATSGYFLEGGVLECALTVAELCDRLGKGTDPDSLPSGLARDIDIVLGFYELEGGQVYNSVLYATLGPNGCSPVSVYRKFFLATYGVFDEDRFISRGHQVRAFETRFGRVGILICEDVWHSVMPTLLALDGAQIIFVPSASPARGFTGETIENVDRYRRLLRAVGEEHGVFCVNSQLVGFEGGKGFVGGSCVVGPFGQLLAEGPIQEEHLLVCDLDLDMIEMARQANPLLADLRSNWDELRRHFDAISQVAAPSD
jgi:predicted amidohydrolase